MNVLHFVFDGSYRYRDTALFQVTTTSCQVSIHTRAYIKLDFNLADPTDRNRGYENQPLD